jgi:predicted aspartyl protease
VRLGVRSPRTGDAAEIDAKLETGADLCALPESVVAALDLSHDRVVRAAGFAGIMHEVPVYRADLALDGQRLVHVEALVTKRAYGLVGRNVLRRLIMRIDGPGEKLEIRWPPPR